MYQQISPRCGQALIKKCWLSSIRKTNRGRIKFGSEARNRLWRHTIGRISNFARLPVYALTLALQTAKMPAKVVLSPATYLLAWALNTKKLDSWKFSGVAKDGIVVFNILDRIGSSILGVITAPPKEYHSIWEVFDPLKIAVFQGAHHDIPQEELLRAAKTLRADYSKILFDHNNPIYSATIPQSGRPENAALYQCFELIKAG